MKFNELNSKQQITFKQRSRDPGKAERQGAVKTLETMETCKKQKNVYNDACFCSATMMTSEIITLINYRF